MMAKLAIAGNTRIQEEPIENTKIFCDNSHTHKHQDQQVLRAAGHPSALCAKGTGASLRKG
jgi:hypothetical protein